MIGSKEMKMMDALKEKGAAKIRVLNADEVTEFLYAYREKFSADRNGFYWSMYNKNKSLASAANDYICEKLLPKLTAHFGHIQPLLSSYFVKPPGGDFIEPHQDWTFIDGEPALNSYTCWIPLIDTDYNSGTLGVVEGSHRLTNHVRASPSPAFPKFTNSQRNLLVENTTFYDLKAGEGIIFDHRIVHASSPSKLNTPRPAVGICFAPAGCTMIHYSRNPKTSDTVFKYSVDRAFYNHYNDTVLAELFSRGQTIPGYPIIGEEKFRALSDEELREVTAAFK